MTTFIQQLYKSRKNVLDILESAHSYDISDYSGFSLSEVDAMSNNLQLDMLLTHQIINGEKKEGPRIYIKYLVGTLNQVVINQFVEDLYIHTNTLGKHDCLYIVMTSEPNDSVIAHLNYLYTHDERFIVVQNIKRLQFNILEHDLVPKVDVLSNQEIEDMKLKYNIINLKNLPEISRYDAQATAICLRPGQICKFTRNSPTSMTTEYFRLCV